MNILFNGQLSILARLVTSGGSYQGGQLPMTKRKGGTLVERYLEWCGWLSYTWLADFCLGRATKKDLEYVTDNAWII